MVLLVTFGWLSVAAPVVPSGGSPRGGEGKVPLRGAVLSQAVVDLLRDAFASARITPSPELRAALREAAGGGGDGETTFFLEVSAGSVLSVSVPREPERLARGALRLGWFLDGRLIARFETWIDASREGMRIGVTLVDRPEAGPFPFPPAGALLRTNPATPEAFLAWIEESGLLTIDLSPVTTLLEAIEALLRQIASILDLMICVTDELIVVLQRLDHCDQYVGVGDGQLLERGECVFGALASFFGSLQRCL
ncbi:MAG: hypothetical protein D6812_08695 [Deltaproteobacteria bacterium]|nr:MAG: hypothetical protein D6812_08695 [Deltaproteobacteria bacterium]